MMTTEKFDPELEKLITHPRFASSGTSGISFQAAKTTGKSSSLKVFQMRPGTEKLVKKNMADHPTREELDAKLKASERYTEASEARLTASLDRISSEVSSFKTEMAGGFENIRSEIRHLENNINSKPGFLGMYGAAITSVIAMAALVFALFQFGEAKFNSGYGLGARVSENTLAIEDSLESNKELGGKIDNLVTRIDGDAAKK